MLEMIFDVLINDDFLFCILIVVRITENLKLETRILLLK